MVHGFRDRRVRCHSNSIRNSVESLAFVVYPMGGLHTVEKLKSLTDIFLNIEIELFGSPRGMAADVLIAMDCNINVEALLGGPEEQVRCTRRLVTSIDNEKQ